MVPPRHRCYEHTGGRGHGLVVGRDAGRKPDLAGREETSETGATLRNFVFFLTPSPFFLVCIRYQAPWVVKDTKQCSPKQGREVAFLIMSDLGFYIKKGTCFFLVSLSPRGPHRPSSSPPGLSRRRRHWRRRRRSAPWQGRRGPPLWRRPRRRARGARRGRAGCASQPRPTRPRRPRPSPPTSPSRSARARPTSGVPNVTVRLMLRRSLRLAEAEKG